MQIHGLVFIIVGIIIGIASYYIPNMQFFYVAAAGFIVWGSYKIIKRVLSKKLLGSEPKTNEFKPRTEDTTPCPKCGLKHYTHANYCQHCGAKLK